VQDPGDRPDGGAGAVHAVPPRAPAGAQGEAVQVDPLKPTLKAPGAKRSKLKYAEPLSNFAINFNLRHYIKELTFAARGGEKLGICGRTGEAVQVDPIKPMLKAPRTERLRLKHGELLSNFAFGFNSRR